jgi:branched-chain amino acid transport system permease protein
MDPQLYGYMLYAISLITVGGIYAIMTLGLNLQWGMTGMLNVGVAGFFAIGAYVGAILTTPGSPMHLGGFGLPVAAGLFAAMLVSAVIAYLVAKVCIRLRADYLAIATIGIAEIFRLIIKVEIWATGGARGISRVPKPFETLPEPWNQVAFMLLILGFVLGLYLLMERAFNSPWGRVMVAIRENEAAAKAAGKATDKFRTQAFVIGCSFMGLAGALMAHYLKFIGPQATEPLIATFLVWVMLIAGGSGNNRGAILGAFLLWTVWSGTEILAGWMVRLGLLGSDMLTQVSYLRVFLIGLLLQIILQKFPGGLIPERRVPFKI